MKKLLLSLVLFSGACFAQVTMTTTCPTSAKAGDAIQCTLATTGTPVGIQGTVAVSPTVTYTVTTPVTGDSIFSDPGGSNKFLLFDIGVTPIPDGNAVFFKFTMPNSPVTFGVTNPVASDASGMGLTVTVNPPVAIALKSNCDLNGDGTVSAADISLMITDIFTGVGNFDVTSVMKVVAASLGGVCTL